MLAHSMGNWVTVEAMRQMKIKGGVPHPEKIGTIMLAAPSSQTVSISPFDASPDEAPRSGDLETARLLGERVAQLAGRFAKG